MDLFVIILYRCNKSYRNCYEYEEDFHSVHDTLDKATEKINQIIIQTVNHLKYDGVDGNSFFEIVKVKMGDWNRETVFCSANKMYGDSKKE